MVQIYVRGCSIKFLTGKLIFNLSGRSDMWPLSEETLPRFMSVKKCWMKRVRHIWKGTKMDSFLGGNAADQMKHSSTLFRLFWWWVNLLNLMVSKIHVSILMFKRTFLLFSCSPNHAGSFPAIASSAPEGHFKRANVNAACRDRNQLLCDQFHLCTACFTKGTKYEFWGKSNQGTF